jgi:FAD/FMN-containing dehydrogenase
MSLAGSVTQLVPSFTGRLLQPTDHAYDDTRRVHNGLIDKRPALIACCAGTADVVDAVALARSLNLEVAVRGGGHNVGGRGTIDGGLMIDLAPMRGIHVDPAARTARVQPGVLWKAFNRETQLHGLATTGGVVGTTGVAGLTLGGGLGWLLPKYGLALDNLRSVEMVMADGAVQRASRDENADLFWAIRGGGGNFGIATWFEFDLHEVGPMISGGLVAHPLQNGQALLRFYRETCANLPDEMMLVAGLLTAPDGSTKLSAIVAAHCGALADGTAALGAIKAYGSPVMDTIGPISYCDQNALFDASLPRGALNYWKSHFLTELSDECLATLVDHFAAAPSPMCQIVIEHFHGAACRVPVDATACILRHPGFNLVIIAQWTDPGDSDRNMAWCREMYRALTPYLSPYRYLNYLDADEEGDPAAAAYGANYARLRELKTKYDPENFFHVNVNIKPR